MSALRYICDPPPPIKRKEEHPIEGTADRQATSCLSSSLSRSCVALVLAAFLVHSGHREYKKEASARVDKRQITMAHLSDFGDHLHAVAIEDGRAVRSYDFDYDEIDRNLGNEPEPEPGIPMHDVAAILSLLLQWACSSDSLTLVGARTASLLAFLNVVDAPHNRRTLAEIAREAGCTRQALSKALLELRDECGIHLTIGKRSYARESFKKAQLAAVEAGVHASVTRRDLNPNSGWKKQAARMQAKAGQPVAD